MSFPYKHVVMVGATSGIGRAMTIRLMHEGAKVTMVGRRLDRLEAFAHEHGKEKVSIAPLDIGDIPAIPGFVSRLMKASPNIDCVFLNAGIQNRYDFSQPKTVDIEVFLKEVTVNFSSHVALTKNFLPYLMSKPSTSLIYTGSNLAIVPAASLPAYSASKAALNAFVLCLRDQLRNTNVKVIEVSPPPVQTELHDVTMGEVAGRKLGMPLDHFIDQAYAGLLAGKDQIVVGSIGPDFNTIIDQRRSAFEDLARMLRGEK